MSALPPKAEIRSAVGTHVRDSPPGSPPSKVANSQLMGRSLAHPEAVPGFNTVAPDSSRRVHAGSRTIFCPSVGSPQVRAQFFGTRAALRRDVDPRPTHAAARESVVNDVWLAVRQNGRVLLLQLAIGAERRCIGRASDQL